MRETQREQFVKTDIRHDACDAGHHEIHRLFREPDTKKLQENVAKSEKMT